MSTPDIRLPRPVPTFRDLLATTRGLARGRQKDPWWSRPGLIAVSVLAAVLVMWALTISGDANSYYADAALAASKSWTAFFTNAADLSGYVSLDKGPLSDWMMGLSGRIFGFGSLSMLLPNALCGVAAVLLLHRLMRRAFGHGTALLAALMLALSPVSVVMARYNNPDALLALLLVAAAWALVRSLESARLRDIVLCGLFVGLAFNTKMLEAYLIVPGLAIAFLIGAQGSVRRRIGHLLAGGAVMGVVSVAWFGTMMLIPAANRPYVGDSTNNSWFQLIFGANGFSRVSGSGKGGFGRGGGGGGLGGATGPLRLLSTEIGGQIAWLLPLALLGVITVLWLRRRTPRSDLRRGTVIILGLWMLAGYLVFSFSKGTFHSYYTSAIAPAVAALAAVALVALGQRARKEWGATITLALAVAGTAVLSYVILSRTPTFVPWLRWTILVAGPLAGTANLLVRLGVRPQRWPCSAARRPTRWRRSGAARPAAAQPQGPPAPRPSADSAGSAGDRPADSATSPGSAGSAAARALAAARRAAASPAFSASPPTARRERPAPRTAPEDSPSSAGVPASAGVAGRAPTPRTPRSSRIWRPIATGSSTCSPPPALRRRLRTPSPAATR
jgi:4-amino-4-deoxy-L-arabinose transferase-like glycosyltransferase